MISNGARPKFLNALRAGRHPIGMHVASTDPAVTEILGFAGFDFVQLDDEASPLTPELALHHVRAAESAGVIPIVRVIESSPTLIRRYLDVGCQGIVIPHLETADQLQQVLAATRFEPRGVRGMCPACHGAHYSLPGHSQWGSWYDPENVLVIPIVESLRGLSNLREILSVEGVDIFVFGAGDLSQELGTSDSRTQSPAVVAKWHEFVKVVHDHGKYVMATPYPEVSAEASLRLLGQGADAIMQNTDLLLFHETVREIAKGLGGSGIRVSSASPFAQAPTH